MVTKAESERLAVLETSMTGVQADVAEVKSDVKTLRARSERWQGGTALMRALVPFIAVGVSLAALVVSMKGG